MPSNSRSVPVRFDALDSLRGLCACLVAVCHFWTLSPTTTSLFVRNSFLFVDFFFVLSGFVIAWNYEHKLTSWRATRDFLLLRLGRLYPLHLFTLGILVGLSVLQFLRYPQLLPGATYGEARSLGAIVSNLLLIQGMHVHGGLTWNEPAWSISVEVWAYVTFASCCVLFGMRNWVISCTVCCLTLVLILFTDNGIGATHDFGFLRCLLGFCFGVLSFHAYREPGSPIALVSNRRATIIEAVVTLVVVTFVCVGANGILSFMAPPVFAVTVYVFAAEKGRVSALLRLQFFTWLGCLSYSIYMMHWIVIDLFWIALNYIRGHWGVNLWGTVIYQGNSIQAYGRDPFEGIGFLVAMLTITVALSAATYRYIETPGREWSRTFVRSKSA